MKFRVLERKIMWSMPADKRHWYQVQYHDAWWRTTSGKFSSIEDAKSEIDSYFDEDIDKVVYEIERDV